MFCCTVMFCMFIFCCCGQFSHPYICKCRMLSSVDKAVLNIIKWVTWPMMTGTALRPYRVLTAPVASQNYLPLILLFTTQEFSDDVCSGAGHMSGSRVKSTKPNMVWTFRAVKRFLDTLTAADGRVSLQCECTHSRCQWSRRSTRYSCQRHRDV